MEMRLVLVQQCNIIKAGFRPGDKADMAYIELVDRKMEDESTSDEPELKEEESAA